jgi:predicted MFS family arabinose efflux permease
LADEWFTFLPAGALESIRFDVKLTYAEAGLLWVAIHAGGLLGGFLIVAADFVSRRLLASLGALVYGLALLAFGLGDSFLVLAVACFFWGAASDAFLHASQVALVDLAGDDLAPALGRQNAYSAIGDFLGPLTLGALAVLDLSWRVAFLGGAGLMLLYAAWLTSQTFPPPHPPEDAESPMQAVWSAMQDRRLLLLALVEALFEPLDEPLQGFVIAFLEEQPEMTTELANALIALLVAAGFVGFVSVQLFTRRFRAERLLIAFTAAMAVALPILLLAPVLAVRGAATAVLGYAFACFFSVLEAAYLGLRPGLAGTSQAVISGVGLLGIGSPALVGTVSDHFGLGSGVALYTLLPVAMLLLLLGYARLQETTQPVP